MKDGNNYLRAITEDDAGNSSEIVSFYLDILAPICKADQPDNETQACDPGFL